ncbi:hypothetical protein Dda_8387 [Drechslerella dactyloides]|uniref:Uncharacterized protein n=1 Tax=Drechslerella dactyloides TaxID=74499 RepID=A0AAD6NFM9_DREDA|nr:hypothetical protein Dda_8387 [Drechslerella dactyloides]
MSGRLGNVFSERAKAQGEPGGAIDVTMTVEYEKDGAAGDAGGLVTAKATIPELNVGFEITMTGKFTQDHSITAKGRFAHWEGAEFVGDSVVAWLNMDSFISHKGENQIFFSTIVDHEFKTMAVFTGGEAPEPSWEIMGSCKWTKLDG